MKNQIENLAEHLQKAWDDKDMEALVAHYTEDAVMYMPGEPPVRGREAIAKNQGAFVRAMPDFKLTFNQVLSSGNHAAFEGVVNGTFTGPLSTPEGDIQPTGNKVQLKFAFFARLNEDGLVEEDRTYFDTADFMRQLGLAD
jgi:steroid delta-isomerase-like uncharacterized protein